MKRKGKHIKLTKDLVMKAIITCLKPAKKRQRFDTRRLFARIGGLTWRTAGDALKERNDTFYEVVEKLAGMMRREIISRKLSMQPVRYKRDVVDSSSGKARDIAIMGIKQLMYDHIAVEALRELLPCVGQYQCASIPNRGQSYGTRALRRWMHSKRAWYAAKLDIRKCYPSTDRELVLAWLRKHYACEWGLWLTEQLIGTSESGFLIGSYLSQTLCNMYLSQFYHEASERMATTKTRRGVTERVPLVNHVLMFMDDILLLSHNKRHLHDAVQRSITYLKEKLGYTVKESWRLFRVTEVHCIDMMGFRVFRSHVTIRRRVWRRARRCFLRISRRIREHRCVPVSLARRAGSYFGYVRYSDSFGIVKRYGIERVMRVAGHAVQQHDKQRAARMAAA